MNLPKTTLVTRRVGMMQPCYSVATMKMLDGPAFDLGQTFVGSGR